VWYQAIQEDHLKSRKSLASSVTGIAFLLACAIIPSLALAGQLTDNSAPTQQNATAGANEVYKVGHDISAPKLIDAVEPKLSKSIRKSRESATAWVRLKLYVETDGIPSNIRVVGVFDRNGAPVTGTDSNPIYQELEDDALEAAKHYRFEPGKKNGKPVRVDLNIAINFHS
jgi:Gram-negative bacterial TonB protein C-terminal